jgi:hypothetical protein
MQPKVLLTLKGCCEDSIVIVGFVVVVVLFCFPVLRIEPGASQILSMHSVTEIHPKLQYG